MCLFPPHQQAAVVLLLYVLKDAQKLPKTLKGRKFLQPLFLVYFLTSKYLFLLKDVNWLILIVQFTSHQVTCFVTLTFIRAHACMRIINNKFILNYSKKNHKNVSQNPNESSTYVIT